MSARPAPLRRRVAWACGLLGLLVGLLAAGAVMLIAEDYETVLAREILRGQAEDYSLRVGGGLPAQLPRTQRLSGYRDAPPARYAGFAPGVHEDPQREGVHIGVFDTHAGRLYFVIDLGDIEALERHLNAWLAVITLGGAVLSGWLGWVFAGRALTPVRTLADAVDALTPSPAPSHLARRMPDDELGHLASAIDGYQARLAESDARQKIFFANASHELRTPIAVVQGATEVLLDAGGERVGPTTPLARLERGSQELADLTEAMFGVAREVPTRAEAIDLAGLAREAWAAWPSASSPVRVEVAGAIEARAARRETVLLLRMLARRVFPGAGTLRLEVIDPLTPAPEPVATPSDTGVADKGAVSELLQRTAERAGWTIHHDGARVHLRARDGSGAVALSGSP